MKDSDLRKDAIDAMKDIKGELKGLIVFATDEEKSVVCIEGKPSTVINLLAGAMMNDPKTFALIHGAMQAVAASKMANIVTSKLN